MNCSDCYFEKFYIIIFNFEFFIFGGVLVLKCEISVKVIENVFKCDVLVSDIR